MNISKLILGALFGASLLLTPSLSAQCSPPAPIVPIPTSSPASGNCYWIVTVTQKSDQATSESRNASSGGIPLLHGDEFVRRQQSAPRGLPSLNASLHAEAVNYGGSVGVQGGSAAASSTKNSGYTRFKLQVVAPPSAYAAVASSNQPQFNLSVKPEPADEATWTIGVKMQAEYSVLNGADNVIEIDENGGGGSVSGTTVGLGVSLTGVTVTVSGPSATYTGAANALPNNRTISANLKDDAKETRWERIDLIGEIESDLSVQQSNPVPGAGLHLAEAAKITAKVNNATFCFGVAYYVHCGAIVISPGPGPIPGPAPAPNGGGATQGPNPGGTTKPVGGGPNGPVRPGGRGWRVGPSGLIEWPPSGGGDDDDPRGRHLRETEVLRRDPEKPDEAQENGNQGNGG